jgi:hypothetical protein
MKNDFVSSCVNYFASQSIDDCCDVGASAVVAESLGVIVAFWGDGRVIIDNIGASEVVSE